MVSKIGLGILLGFIASVTSAGPLKNTICKYDAKHHAQLCVQAPEVDPASAIAGLTLMIGGLAVLRGRRVKRPIPTGA